MSSARSIAFAFVLVLLAVAAPASADEPRTLSDSLSGEARTHYDIARILYRDGDWAGALAKFKRAHELSHEPRLYWNMAACEKNLRHYVRVLGLVEQYVHGATLTKDELEKANTFSAAVRALVGEVTVTVSEPGASLTVDDEPAGTSPFEKPILMDQGSRKLRLVRTGFRPLEKTFAVEGGAKQSVSFALEREVGRVTVRARPSEAIQIDERTMGQGAWSGALPVGAHVLVVSASSGKSRRADFVLADRETREFVIEVEQASSGLPKWVYFAGGGVLLAGAAVGGYFLFRPKPAEPLSGTMGSYQVP